MIIIPKLSKAEFIKKIQNKKYENVELIKVIEAYFIKKRGFIYKMPPKGSSVILLLSGGLDSTITWGLLIKLFHYRVYPLFFHRGHTRYKREKKSVDYFYRFFKKQFHGLCEKPFEISTDIPPQEFENISVDPLHLHGEHILRNLQLNKKVSTYQNIGVLPYIFAFFGAAYGRLLYDTHNISIRDVFCAVGVRDGDVVPSQSFTALRSTMLDFCVATADYQWQFSSFLFEKETGQYIQKYDLIRMAHELGWPIEHTWSCYRNEKYQCGDRCLACIYRKDEFKKAGIADKTLYMSDNISFLLRLKRILW